MSERITGWAEIAEYYEVSERTAQRRRREMEDMGVIFTVWEGRPPRKKVCSFPNLLQTFVIKRGRF